MKRLTRPLTERDKKLLEIHLIQAKHGVTESFSWTMIIAVSFFSFLVGFTAWGRSIILFSIAVLLPITIIGLYIKWVLAARNKYREDVIKVEQLLQDNEVRVIRYHCSDALVFETSIDIRHIWALQIAPNQVMIWHDYAYAYAGFLPAKTFDVIEDDPIYGILGESISNTTDSFPPTYISMETIGNAALDNLPESGVILQTTLNDLLEEAKQWV